MTLYYRRRAIKVAQNEMKFTSSEFSKAFGRVKYSLNCTYTDASYYSTGGGVALGGEMLKRLEAEGGLDTLQIYFTLMVLLASAFVLEESTVLDDMGLSMTIHQKKGKNVKGKGTTNKSTKPRKNMQKSRYVFNKEVLSKAQYLDNFKPDDQDVESRLLGISEMASSLFLGHRLSLKLALQTKEMRSIRYTAGLIDPIMETQTQDETQDLLIGRGPVLQKRPTPHDDPDASDTSRNTKRVKMSLAIGVDLAE